MHQCSVRDHVFAIGIVVCLSPLVACTKSHEAGAPPADAERPDAPSIRFADVSAASGVDFRHQSGASGEHYVLETMGSGAAAFDCDGDGDLDLLLRQGGSIPGGRISSTATDRLYRNDSAPGTTWRFIDVTAGSGLDRPAYGMGVATGDIDGDGAVDLYLTNYGPNRLLVNLGGCRFEDRTVAAGAGDDRWSTAASFFDMDRDGDLDLFVGNYLDFTLRNHKTCFQATGAVDYCAPDAYGAVPSRLLRNRGDGTFEDVTVASGLASPNGKTLGSIAADFDDDGWVDLFVANDTIDNRLWRNRGDGTFEEVAQLLGCALNSAGVRTGDMGVDAADFDGDGDFDLLSTHFAVEGASLWRNDGTGGFWDSAAATGTLASTLGLTGFGARWFDPDLDSHLDLFIANGGVRFIDRLASSDLPRTLEQPNLLARNVANRYQPVGSEAGAILDTKAVSRAVVVADFDNDGDPDLLVTRNDGPALLMENLQPASSEWTGVRLILRDGKREALGAEARLALADSTILLRRAYSDGSYLSAGDSRVVFGLRGRATAKSLAIRWPDGSEESFPAPPPGRYSDLVQGTGSVPGLAPVSPLAEE